MKLHFYFSVAFCSVLLAPFVSCGGGGSAPAQDIAVTVFPQSAQLRTGSQRPFGASVAGTENKGVIWSLEEPSGQGAQISQSGAYIAPMEEGTFRIIATSQADPKKSGAATAQVFLPGSLAYTDPAQGDYFRFVKNTSLSTHNKLVLDLVAAGQAQCSGVAFSVSIGNPGAADWAKVAASDPMMARNGGVFNLGSGPLGLLATLTRSQLNAIVSQKGGGGLANPNNGALASIALATPPNSEYSGAIILSVDKFQILSGPSAVTDIAPANVKFGTLTVW